MLKRLTGALVLTLCTIATTQAMEIATNFWDINWNEKGDAFIDHGNVIGDNPWNETFLAEIDFYTMLRFMDWDRTNSSARTDWSQRRLKSSRVQDGPVAYEWMIDLCNRVNADMWVCIPHQTISEADSARPSDYALRLAILIKTGVDMKRVNLTSMYNQLGSMSAQQLIAAGGEKTCDPLKSTQKVYFEYSNEIWNISFNVNLEKHPEEDPMNGQLYYCTAKGRMLKLDVLLNKPFEQIYSSDLSFAQGFGAWASIRMFRAVELVFGENSPRIVKVLPQQSSQRTKTFSPQIRVYKDTTRVDGTPLNRWKIWPDAIAIAPYFGSGLNGASTTVWDVLSGPAINKMSMKASIDETRGYSSNSAKPNGLKLIAYEGGQHLVNNPQMINYDPKMYSLYTEYLDSLGKYMSVFAHYVHQGSCGTINCWGAKKRIGDPMSGAPKLKALYDWARNNPVSNTIRPSATPLHRAAPSSFTNGQAFDLHGRRIDGSTQSATRVMLLRDEFGQVVPRLGGTLTRTR